MFNKKLLKTIIPLILVCIVGVGAYYVTFVDKLITYQWQVKNEEVTPENVRDFDRILKTVKLGGRPFPIPCTLNDLGSAYDLDEVLTIEKEGKKDEYIAGIFYKDKDMTGVTIRDYNKELAKINNRRVIICGIENFLFAERPNDEWNVEIDGFTIGDSIEEIIKFYGEPDEIKEYPYKDKKHKAISYVYIEGKNKLVFQTDSYIYEMNYNQKNADIVTGILIRNLD